MTDWSWLSVEGNTGELPIEVNTEGSAEILIGYAEGFKLGDCNILTNDELRVGDICILTCEVTAVIPDTTTTIDIIVHNVEYIKREPESDSKLNEMMTHLDDAKKIRRERQQEKTCSNCASIDSSTRITAKDDRQDRDLHYCGQCGRLLSTKEYNKWLDINSKN